MTDRPAPGARELSFIFLVAIALRLVALGAMGAKVGQWADTPYRSDGGAYIANAVRINGGPLPSAYDQRVFVGLPWVIAMAHRAGLPYGAAAQGLCLLFSGGLCIGVARWLNDSRIGWGLALLPPHWVLDSSAVMNESLMLWLCVSGLCVAGGLNGRVNQVTAPRDGRVEWGRMIGAAILLAAAGMVRPMACFAVAGGGVMLLQKRRPREAVILLLATAVVLAGLFAAFRYAYWNPLENARVYQTDPGAYNGQTLTWPFGSFVQTARARGALHANYLYKLIYVLAGIGVAILAVRQWMTSRAPLDALAATWWTLNLAFVSCIGSHWGVDIAQRSIMWAAPAGYWALRAWLPTKWYWRLAWALLPAPFVFITSQT